MNQQIKAYASNGKDDNNVTIVDWGGVIWERSVGDQRLHGDIDAHYDLEARLLFGQQLLHELLRVEEEKLASQSS